MQPDELEFKISQYLDGTLAPSEKAELELQLQTNPDVRQLLADYRSLQARMDQTFLLPSVKWDQLAAHLSAAVAQAENPVIAGRIGFGHWQRRFAIAASMLIIATAGLLLSHIHRLPVPSQQLATSLLVIGPQAEAAQGAAVEEISIGASPSLAATGESWKYAQGIVAQPARAVIVTNLDPDSAQGIHLR